MQVIRSHPFRAACAIVPLIAAAVALYLFGGDLYQTAITWIYSEQKAFHKSMTTSLSAFADKAGVSTGFAIVFGSFLYGVFHAAGPGHGKVILSTYLLSQPEQVKKSVLMSVASAFMQGIVAVTLVYGLFYAFGIVARDTKIAVTWSERIAFIMVMGVGAMLVWRAIKGFGWFNKATAHSHHHSHSHDHNHDHGHSHDHGHGHHHIHEDGTCSTCGHAHVPSAEQLATANDWKTVLGVIFSIGMRPCSGAILVLVFAKFAGIPVAGIFAVAAISLGTAITVSALAILSVQARKLAVSLLDGAVGMADVAGNVLALIGGAILILMGYGLFQASFDAPVRSMGL